MLDRAASSVRAQTHPTQLILARDVHGMGAAVTRQCGISMVETEWTAFLDSDDEMDPDHIEHLVRCAGDTGADYVYPWFRVVGGHDPFPAFFGKPWDDDAPHSTTITILVRTGLARQVGFEGVYGEDFRFTKRCVAAGAQIVHLPRRSWTWNHHGANSSGRPGHGDAGAQQQLTGYAARKRVRQKRR
jgi:glycosyltransferase involved in cell wall biosynthesis